MILIKTMKKKHKFDSVYEGPFKVINVHDKYVEVLKGGKKVTVHKNLVKKTNAETDWKFNVGAN